ncbi:hypothetical protein BGZ80_010861, partial [Entomortierella chlamydospora]
EGRFADFEKLVREAPCQHDPAFRLGVCQRLGEIAANSIWDSKTRKCAVEFLRQLYKDDANNGQQFNIVQWMLNILNQLAESSKDIIEDSTHELLQEILASSSHFKGTIHHGCESDIPVLHPIMASPPPMESPLLDCVQNKTDVETSLHQLKRERLKNRDRDVYISPRAKATSRATNHFDLTAKVQEFLTSDGKVFLILGDSGSGKSTFNRALEIDLWDSYDKINGQIPLFIHLPAVDRPEQNLIDKHLRRAKFTEPEILELKAHREFVIICDGYDESQQTRNLYMSNQLNQPGGWRVQMVISCRTDYIGADYRHCFEPSDRNNNGEAKLFQEAIISPFNIGQIQSYVAQYVSLRKPSWKSEDYQQAFKKIPNLQDLVKNPFLLKLALEVLPRLLGNDNNYSTTRITRVELYDEFVAQWIERGKKRLAEMELSSRDKLVFKQLSGSGFQQRGIAYLKELAAAIYEHQDGKPVVHYSGYEDHRTWKEAFFSDRDGCNLLREALPLTRNGDQYRFINRSLLEYGLSLAVFGSSKRNDTEVIPPVSRRGSTSSVLSLENSSTERTATADDQSLLDSPLGKRNLVGERSILQFLDERVQQEPLFKDQLHSVIKRSKSDKAARTGATNAITILVRAGIQFIGVDLRNIQIPGADLSFGMFDSAQLEGADLREVNLRNVWMRQANLRGAQMNGVQFGELPFLKEDSGVVCTAYSPDGKTLAVGLGNGDISLYETMNWNRTQGLKGHSGSINSISFSATSDRIASGSSDKKVRLWDVDTGECVSILQGHGDWVLNVVYSPDGDQIASGSDDRIVRLWDVDTGECIHALHGHRGSVLSVTYSPKGDRIASGSEDSTVRLWDIDTGECIRTLQGHNNHVVSVVYSPKGDRVASGSDDKTVRLWDADTGKCVHTLEGHSDRVTSIVYSPKGDQVASGSHDSTVRLWDVDTGECVHTLQGHSSVVNSVVYSPKGDRIASGSDDNTVRLWDIDSDKCVHIFRSHRSGVNCVVYSPKGDRIASGSDDKTVRLWNVDTGECVHTLQGHSSEVSIVVYSPKGDRIASGSFDDTVRLWDIDTGDCIHTFQGHSGSVDSVVYSPKGDRIASGSSDSTVKLWNVETGECLVTISGFSNLVSSIALESNFDAQCLITGSWGKSVRRWRITKEGAEHKAVLCWSSSHEVLTVNDLSFEDVQGLSRLNRELLIQRGALTPSPLPSDREGVEKVLD